MPKELYTKEFLDELSFIEKLENISACDKLMIHMFLTVEEAKKDGVTYESLKAQLIKKNEEQAIKCVKNTKRKQRGQEDRNTLITVRT